MMPGLFELLIFGVVAVVVVVVGVIWLIKKNENERRSKRKGKSYEGK